MKGVHNWWVKLINLDEFAGGAGQNRWLKLGNLYQYGGGGADYGGGDGVGGETVDNLVVVLDMMVVMLLVVNE